MSRCRSPDIAYGLWRSGHPRQDADSLDLARLRQFMHGHASTVRLPLGAARAPPVYLYGRGLQMIAKRVQARQPETGMLAETAWIAANAPPITDAAAAALP